MPTIGLQGHLRSRASQPRRGDGFYHAERHAQGKQPNGKIVRVDYQEKEVLVKFFDDNDFDSFSFDQLEGCWSDGANQYQIFSEMTGLPE